MKEQWYSGYAQALCNTYPHRHLLWHSDCCGPKIVGQLWALAHVSPWGLGQSCLLVQYKQDFYRHVYEQLVVVPCFGAGWAELGWVVLVGGEEGGKDWCQAGQYYPVWASGSYTMASALSGFSSGCCFMWALLQGDTNCQHSSSVNGIGQCTHVVGWCLVGVHNGSCKESTPLWKWAL